MNWISHLGLCRSRVYYSSDRFRHRPFGAAAAPDFSIGKTAPVSLRRSGNGATASGRRAPVLSDARPGCRGLWDRFERGRSGHPGPPGPWICDSGERHTAAATSTIAAVLLQDTKEVRSCSAAGSVPVLVRGTGGGPGLRASRLRNKACLMSPRGPGPGLHPDQAWHAAEGPAVYPSIDERTGSRLHQRNPPAPS